jgi:hypothetical protein
MSAATTTEQPVFLSTHVFEQDIPPTIADGIAALLGMDRQIIIVTGKIDGRMAGFLADLTHCISRRGSLLRIKSPLGPDELHTALAGQLHLPSATETPIQLASRIGHRLQQPAPRGRYVLLCEAADQYGLSTLEAIRQISNYPVSIVLVGGHGLSRRLRRASLRSLRQRVTHQLSLNRFSILTARFWLALLGLLAGGTLLLYLQGTPSQEPAPTEDAAPPRPISLKTVAEPQVVPAPAMPELAVPEPAVVEAQPAPPPADPELRLTLDHALSAPPSTASKSQARP